MHKITWLLLFMLPAAWAEVVITGCPLSPYSSNAACNSEPDRCAIDYNTETCSEKTCRLIFVENDCTNFNCEWHSDPGACTEPGVNPPCSLFNHEGCPTQECFKNQDPYGCWDDLNTIPCKDHTMQTCPGTRCRWELNTECVDNSDPNFAACHQYLYQTQENCPTNLNCAWDDAANYCKYKTTDTLCEYYNSANCPSDRCEFSTTENKCREIYTNEVQPPYFWTLLTDETALAFVQNGMCLSSGKVMMKLNFADPTKCDACYVKDSEDACDGLNDVFVYKKDNMQTEEKNCNAADLFFKNEIFLDHIFKNDDFVVALEMVAGDCNVIDNTKRAAIVKKSDIVETECKKYYSVSDWSQLCLPPDDPPATTEESDEPTQEIVPSSPPEFDEAAYRAEHCVNGFYHNIGNSYSGATEFTISGRQCQDWSAQTPHTHTYTPTNWPNDGLEDGAYCRSPDSRFPWCYTTDAEKEWEYCGEKYRGTLGITVGGRQCQDWSVQTPHTHEHTPEDNPNEHLEDGAYCRSPDTTRHENPWCYTTDADKEWEYCDVCAEPPTTTPPRVLKKAARGVLAGGMGATIAFSLVGVLLLAVGLPLALYRKGRYK